MPPSFKPSRLLGIAAILIGIGGILVPGGGPAGAATAKATGGPACGGIALTKATGLPWVCTFDDEFDGAALNRTKWTVQRTAAGGFRAGDGCVVDNPKTVSVSGGNLNLSVYRVAAPFACALPRGSFATTWYAGSVYTKSFSQAYGRFSVRAKFPDADGIRGLQSAIWTYPRTMSPNNAFSGTSEIDIAEAYSQWPDLIGPTVHNFLGGSTDHCLVPDWGAKFHTYTVEWTPQRATFIYDGVACFWAGRVGTAEPFLIALTQALGVRGNTYSAATPSPATMQVAWVRVWK
ncbi:MAG: hypothetical protein QOI15_1884 [Pseudonocardiales bacterium]|nr:hypothetical protein [Pseudonocardiales bacterium]